MAPDTLVITPCTDGALRGDGADSLPPHIPVLDGLRGAAVLAVMLFHFTAEADDALEGGTLLSRPGHAGWVGVCLFFVLSGFLITRILSDAKEQPRYFLNFYMRRVLRIFPLYFAALTMAFGLQFLFPSLLTRWIGNAAERQGWWWLYGTNIVIAHEGHWLSPMLDHFWTLAVEEHFYLVWPFLVFLLERRTLLWICGGLMVAAPVLRVIMVWDDPTSIAPYVLTPCRVDSLAAGALGALAMRSEYRLRLAYWARRIAPLTAALLVAAVLWRRGWAIADPVVQSIGLSVQTVFFASVLIAAVTARYSKEIEWLCDRSGLTVFGKYSYGLYVFHVMLFPAREVFLLPIMHTSLVQHPVLQFTVYVFLAGASSLLVAMVSWHCYEKQLLKLKRLFGPTSRHETRSQLSFIPQGASSATP